MDKSRKSLTPKKGEIWVCVEGDYEGEHIIVLDVDKKSSYPYIIQNLHDTQDRDWVSLGYFKHSKRIDKV